MAKNTRIVRNSLLKSSLSIKSIQSSVTKFRDGILKARGSSAKIAQTTSESNKFKQTLIGKDNEYFRKRREGIARKQREDELEATTVGGAIRRQGNVIAKSTRGFLGRILDFIGVLLLGWLLNTLPGIIKAVGALIKNMRKLVNILTGFVDGIRDILSSIGGAIDGFLGNFRKQDYDKQKQELDENLTKAEQGYAKMNDNLVTATLPFQDLSNFGLTEEDLKEEPDEIERLKNEQEGGEEETEDDTETDQTQNVKGQQTTDPNDNFVQRQPSFIKTEAQRNAEIENEQGADSELNSGISSLQTPLLQKLNSEELPKNIEGLEKGIQIGGLDSIKNNASSGGDNSVEVEQARGKEERENFSVGGKVEGQSGIDNVLAKLTSGEFIMTKETTERIGASFFEKLNKGGKLDDMIKPNADMIEEIQTQLVDKTTKIQSLAKKRKGSTIMMIENRTTQTSAPPNPPMKSQSISIPAIKDKSLKEFHHILHRYT